MRARPALRAAAALALLLAGFAWGFVARGRRIFPFALLRRAMSRSSPAIPAGRSPGEGVANLASLPYLSGSYDPEAGKRGVLLHSPEKSFDGYSLYSSGRGRCSFLVDMGGRVLWKWCADALLGGARETWINFHLGRSGAPLVNVQESGIFRLDERARVVWKFPAPTHHDLTEDAAGAIHAPVHRGRPGAPVYGEEILDDAVLSLDASGRRLGEISLFDLFAGSPYDFLLPRTRGEGFRGPRGLEPFHLNHVEAFDGRLAQRSPIYAAGNLLVSMRHNSCVAIVDPRERRIVWAWGPGNVELQHDPTVLENGHILIFDNGQRRSELVEVDPLTNRVVWKYAPARGFFSADQGAAQRLPNGNTLVTESDRGYAFEVTPAGEVVWRFANPEVDAKGFRSGILRMTRYPESEKEFLLAHLPDPNRAGK